MEDIYKLAYKLYTMGLEKEAEHLDDIVKTAGRETSGNTKKCKRCGATNECGATNCSSCGYTKFSACSGNENQSNDAKDKKKKTKRDACYYKVKSRYKKWPSAYASGALVKCRSVGAKNWGEGGSKKKKKRKSKRKNK